MTRGRVDPATAADVEAILLDTLREQDQQEMAALGKTPEAALRGSFKHSFPHAFAIKVIGSDYASDTAVGMIGVAPFPGSESWGVPWMLASEGIHFVGHDVWHQVRPWVDYMNALYPVLTNWVDVRNTVSRRWLEHAGFTFDEARVPVGDTHFVRFHRHATGS